MLHSVSLESHSPTVAEVDLTAFKENTQKLKKHVEKSMLLAVVKTNAYGHGIIPIGHEAVNAGADRLGVTTVEEGAMLRESGISAPIHILSSVIPEQAVDIVSYRLTASISSRKLARAISEEATKQGQHIPVHLKLDTGLHRFGVDPHDVVDFCNTCYHLQGLYWEGIYTHFSSADEGDWQLTEQQYTLFMETVIKLNKQGFNFPVRHVGGSTITIERKDMHLEMVRPGLALFGYHPVQRQQGIIKLKPVMKIKSQLLHVREIPANTPVGYGGSYVTSTKEKIAIVPIGHGDGYQRLLSNKGEMLVKGKRVKIVGTISLDQTLINVTGIPDISSGDEVILLGRQGDEEISARDIANWIHSVVDEVLASLMERVRREYV
ncbi:alanine racemase [Virgibacillus phasianinus]|uniref:Alanine racemase n=1 Tax=Virgibacillus phasianinus TaxID=2017483 RepID=A0A220U8G6_9BACI|nr:alanine racemase [Virgibacillus phasianinus]ASK64390.1 alanine racemase [Virgibacillus phasianinus]